MTNRIKCWGMLAFLFCLLLPAPAQTPAVPNASRVRERYTKYEFMIPMRDGARLFTLVYAPKDTSQKYPFLLTRTPYSVAPYGIDSYRASLGPSEHFEKEGFIFVYQDARGRYLSEGEFQQVRPHVPNKRSPKDIDESSDAYDTIEWLLKNVPNNNGRVGMVGISQPGFHVAASMIDSHPALKAASPQAPTADYYINDDVYHNGAFMLAANFGFYSSFRPRKGAPGTAANTATRKPAIPPTHSPLTTLFLSVLAARQSPKTWRSVVTAAINAKPRASWRSIRCQEKLPRCSTHAPNVGKNISPGTTISV